MKNASDIWQAAIPYIKNNISDTGYSTVFTKMSPAYVEDGVLYLYTTNALYKDMFEIYKDPALRAVRKVCGYDADIRVIIEEASEAVPSKADKEESSESVNTNINKKFTFENFIVGKNSEFAYAAAYSIAQGPVKDTYNPLFLYGGSGLGKTHLLHAVGNEVMRQDPSKNVLYVTAEKFVNSFIESIRTENNVYFRRKFRNIDVLLLDDIQFFAGKEGTQEEFFHTFNELVNQNKQIMLTSDRPPKDIYPLEERLRTRLSGGLMADLQPPDFETRIAILHSKIENNNFNGEISYEILSLVAQQVKSNIRELEGAIRTIIAWSDIQKKDIDVDTANTILEQYFTSSQKRKIDADYIIKEVQKHFHLQNDTITSSKRDKAYAYPRQIAMYICRELTHLSLPEIGKEFGRDHSTVLHNINKIKREMEKDLDTMNYINDLVKNIKNVED